MKYNHKKKKDFFQKILPVINHKLWKTVDLFEFELI